MTLIVAGLAASGAINTALGLAVLLGADVGSAIVSSIFASGSSFTLWLSPLLLFCGYVVHSWSEELRPHNLGRILIGLGLMLLSLTLIKQASAPLSTATLFHEVLGAVGSQRLLILRFQGRVRCRALQWPHCRRRSRREVCAHW